MNLLRDVQGALRIYRKAGESPWAGIGLSKYDLPSLEIADHWFPEHVVAVDFCTTPIRRYWYENGHERHRIIHTGFVSIQYPGELRRFRWDGPVRTVVVRIDPELMRQTMQDELGGPDLQLLSEIGRDDEKLRSLVLALHDEREAGWPEGALYGEALATKLCEELAINHSVHTVRPAEYKGGLSKWQLRRLIDYIESSLSEDLTIDALTHVANLSRYHLGKMFKQSVGVTLHQYLTWRRIRLAQQLLRNKHSSLADIARSTGFASQSHFTTVFFRTMAVTPSKYRSIIAS